MFKVARLETDSIQTLELDPIHGALVRPSTQLYLKSGVVKSNVKQKKWLRKLKRRDRN